MGTYGLETFDKVGTGITVSADGNPKQKHGGITIDWASLTALVADTVFLDNDYVKAGEKYIRYGTVMCRITAATDTTKIGKFVPYGTTGIAGGTLSTSKGDICVMNYSVHEEDRMSDFCGEAIEGGRVYKSRLIVEDAGGQGSETQTVTLGVGNTGGTFTLTFSGQTTSGLAFNVAASAVQTALEALSNIAPGDVTVTGAAGGPFTVVFSGVYLNVNVPAMTGTGSLTGGANTVVIATTVLTGMPLATFETALPNILYASEV